MSNLYKRHNTVTSQSQYCVINSNQMVAEKLEELARCMRGDVEFTEGLDVQEVQQQPEISLEEIQKEADQMLKEAQEKAQQMIENANEQVEAITEAAKADGERKGYEAGQKKAMQEMEEQKKRLEERRDFLEAEYQRSRDALEPQIVDAVCEVFGKVFHVQFDNNREILLHLVKNTILKIESTKEFQIRVSKKNYQYLEAHKNEILSQVGQNIQLDIEADASLDETQCVMETDSGFFECGIDVQLENLIKAIRSLSV